MRHLALISTSYPDQTPGSEAAGSFVADFAETLSRHLRVTVLAPALQARCDTQGNLTVQRFPAPQLPLSLLKPANPLHWPAILRTLRAGRGALHELAAAGPIDHVLALWALPSGHWARTLLSSRGIPYSVWALGSDIWTLRHVPVVKTVLRGVLKDAKYCFADGHALKQDVTDIAARECAFLPSTRRLEMTAEKDWRTNRRTLWHSWDAGITTREPTCCWLRSICSALRSGQGSARYASAAAARWRP